MSRVEVAPTTAPGRRSGSGQRSDRERGAADVAMRRLLRIRPKPPKVDDDDVHRLFSTSILLSAFRCLLSYIILPILTPALGAAAGVGPLIGLPVGIIALVFDVRGIRRFFIADHQWRWPITALYLIVMGLVTSLVIKDIVHLTH